MDRYTLSWNERIEDMLPGIPGWLLWVVTIFIADVQPRQASFRYDGLDPRQLWLEGQECWTITTPDGEVIPMGVYLIPGGLTDVALWSDEIPRSLDY